MDNRCKGLLKFLFPLILVALFIGELIAFAGSASVRFPGKVIPGPGDAGAVWATNLKGYLLSMDSTTYSYAGTVTYQLGSAIATSGVFSAISNTTELTTNSFDITIPTITQSLNKNGFTISSGDKRLLFSSEMFLVVATVYAQQGISMGSTRGASKPSIWSSGGSLGWTDTGSVWSAFSNALITSTARVSLIHPANTSYGVAMGGTHDSAPIRLYPDGSINCGVIEASDYNAIQRTDVIGAQMGADYATWSEGWGVQLGGIYPEEAISWATQYNATLGTMHAARENLSADIYDLVTDNLSFTSRHQTATGVAWQLGAGNKLTDSASNNGLGTNNLWLVFGNSLAFEGIMPSSYPDRSVVGTLTFNGAFIPALASSFQQSVGTTLRPWPSMKAVSIAASTLGFGYASSSKPAIWVSGGSLGWANTTGGWKKLYADIFTSIQFTPQPAPASSGSGSVAYADSDNWNPGEGRGLYCSTRNGTNSTVHWKRLW
jgi:hypothetical protein